MDISDSAIQYMASSARSFSTYDPACDNCRWKKIRCDRARPRCGNCRRACVTCVFSAREKKGLPERKDKSVNDVDDRLIRLENTMDRLSRVMETRLPPPASTTSSPTSLSGPVNLETLDSVGPIKTGYECPEFPTHFNPLKISLHGQRFLYGPISPVTQCFGIHECLSRSRPDYPYSKDFNDNLTRLKGLCHILTHDKSTYVDFKSDFLQLPHQQRLEASVELFLAQSSFPELFFHPNILRSQISNLRHDAFSPNDIAVRLCLVYILMQTNTWNPTISTDSYSSTWTDADYVRDLPTLFLLVAKAAMAKGFMQKCCTADIQALIAIALVAIRSADLLLAELTLSRACVLAKQVGLHRDQYLGEELLEAFEERQLVFWVLYTIDKSLSLTLQRNCALPTFECSTPLPSALGPTCRTIACIPAVLARIQLAGIQEQISSGLFSATVMHQSVTGRQENIQVLLDQLEAWRSRNEISADRENISGLLTDDQRNGFLYAYHSCLIVIHSQSAVPHQPEILVHGRKALEYFCADSDNAVHRIHSYALLLVFQGEPLIALFTILKQTLSSMNPQESSADSRLLRKVALLRNARAAPYQGHSPLTRMDEVIHTLATIGCNRWIAPRYSSIDNRRASRSFSTLSSESNILSPLTKPVYDFHLQNTSHDMATSPAMWNSDADLSWLLTERSLHTEHYSTGEFPTDPVIALDSILGDPLDLNARNAISFDSLGERHANERRGT
ncbi:hypothetical protein P171DRAFT_477886 [Karstenula rhodostoma CBS 690.94]|uniref:Zn(2)-C6 fungal-type domain-containing protein n=1 Tax=Karstenula rhodostoma CBS 690.94 TaxID=1392251 RepID=A0A9P4P640_9PLEO|nr:hypothetical protein P171DRAFT_477886 [Karstenula rhodostoma CBS 690.94]